MSIKTRLLKKFADFSYRHAYAEDYLDSAIATQIKVLREQREMTQAALAEKLKMTQSQVARMESVNNSGWQIRTLKRVAKALDLMLVVKFESFGNVLPDIETFGREALKRPSFNDDPVFKPTIEVSAQTDEAAVVNGGAVVATQPKAAVQADNTFAFTQKQHVA